MVTHIHTETEKWSSSRPHPVFLWMFIYYHVHTYWCLTMYVRMTATNQIHTFSYFQVQHCTVLAISLYPRTMNRFASVVYLFIFNFPLDVVAVFIVSPLCVTLALFQFLALAIFSEFSIAIATNQRLRCYAVLQLWFVFLRSMWLCCMERGALRAFYSIGRYADDVSAWKRERDK